MAMGARTGFSMKLGVAPVLLLALVTGSELLAVDGRIMGGVTVTIPRPETWKTVDTDAIHQLPLSGATTGTGEVDLTRRKMTAKGGEFLSDKQTVLGHGLSIGGKDASLLAPQELLSNVAGELGIRDVLVKGGLGYLWRRGAVDDTLPASQARRLNSFGSHRLKMPGHGCPRYNPFCCRDTYPPTFNPGCPTDKP